MVTAEVRQASQEKAVTRGAVHKCVWNSIKLFLNQGVKFRVCRPVFSSVRVMGVREGRRVGSDWVSRSKRTNLDFRPFSSTRRVKALVDHFSICFLIQHSNDPEISLVKTVISGNGPLLRPDEGAPAGPPPLRPYEGKRRLLCLFEFL